MSDKLRVAEDALVDAVAVTQNSAQFLPTIVALAERVLACFEKGGKLYFCGNGGSACDGAHIATEFTGRFKRERAPYPALALTADSGLLTCTANDYSYEDVFSRQVQALARPEDIGFFITTSGNSANVLKALEAANEIGCETVAMLGKTGGKAKGMAQTEIIIPSDNTARIQEVHKLLLHIMCELVDQELAKA